MAAREIDQQRTIDIRRIVILHRLAISLLEVPDQFRVERSRPRHPALQERESKRWETPWHAAQEQRFAHGLRARREVADMIVHVVTDRVPRSPSVTHRMKRR